jgi:hypothetical protein
MEQRAHGRYNGMSLSFRSLLLLSSSLLAVQSYIDYSTVVIYNFTTNTVLLNTGLPDPGAQAFTLSLGSRAIPNCVANLLLMCC